MVLDCFGNNYLGIRGECDGQEPSSGLYINDLPGISLKLASKIADEESIKGVKLLRQLEHTATLHVWQDLQKTINRNFSINKILDNKITSNHRYDIEPEYLNFIPNEVGAVIEKVDCDDYTSICINSISVRSNTTISDKEIKIIDGDIEHLFSIDLVAGKVAKLNVNFKAKTDYVKILIDGSDVLLEDNQLGRSCGIDKCMEQSCEYVCSQCCFSVRGFDGSDLNSKAYGMVLNISCVCCDELLLCDLVKTIAPLVQYKAGILLMYEVLNSDRCNFVAMNSKDDANRMLMAWNGGILSDEVEVKGEYWSLLETISDQLDNYLINLSTKCVSCNSMKIIESIP